MSFLGHHDESDACSYCASVATWNEKPFSYGREQAVAAKNLPAVGGDEKVEEPPGRLPAAAGGDNAGGLTDRLVPGLRQQDATLVVNQGPGGDGRLGVA